MRRLQVVLFPPDSLFSLIHLHSVLPLPKVNLLSPVFLFAHLSTCLLPLPVFFSLSLSLSIHPSVFLSPAFRASWQPVDEKHSLVAGAVDDPDSVQLSF